MSKQQNAGFDQLLAQLAGHGDMTKSMGAQLDEEEVSRQEEAKKKANGSDQAAAAAAAKQQAAGGDDDEDDDDELFGKSMIAMKATVDGEEVDVLDGIAIMRAISKRQNQLAKSMVSSLGNMVDINRKLMAENASIRAEMGDLRKALSAPGGRMATLSVIPPASVAGAGAPASPDGEGADGEYLTKGMALFDEGKFSGVDLQRVETMVNNSIPLTPEIKARIDAAAKR